MTKPHVCIDRTLPALGRRESIAAAMQSPFFAVMFFRKMWPNGSTIRYKFLGGNEWDRENAARAFHIWSSYVNLTFQEVTDRKSEVRISFDPNDGAWSYMGTDALSITDESEPTMNVGFEDGGTALHEVGHMLGLGHEHQNPEKGISWNVPEVMRDLSGPPNNWTTDQIRWNVLEKYSVDHTKGTAFDPKSVMLYWFPKEWTVDGMSTEANHELSENDKQFISRMYPGKVPIQPSLKLDAMKYGHLPVPGAENTFAFSAKENGTYIFKTRGPCNVAMKLFDVNNNLIKQDDDSGVSMNARIVRSLPIGSYLIQIRRMDDSGNGEYTLQATKRKI